LEGLLKIAKDEFKQGQSLDSLSLKKKYSNEPIDKVVKNWEEKLVLETDETIPE
jgi:hypothetical protein